MVFLLARFADLLVGIITSAVLFGSDRKLQKNHHAIFDDLLVFTNVLGFIIVFTNVKE
jgi:hypothetical protein